ncbi:50S ribosomal protein L15 [Candidatus Wirthbacteria bacterium CG2_30_54_11]|uniref:Large ribosomal subunit protein uL15 n=1 Tax=Candidatus Wirthbacteria bacterium CG2_30_54_11 TaxID=1817892 RepID=A0A1J5IPT0_9BACT|nr:ribosomal protein L15 [uncultured bacterium]OIP99181.1 MAG: 50S ribosomal protein L15 [Candidatus Wirthbacteria bacterium CG2_30_54_11]
MLNSLPKVAGKHKKIAGRGNASGKGNRSGRGNKGQNSRSGRKSYYGFEGGQTRLAKRLPKLRGFANINKVDYQLVNVGKLESFPAGETVNREALLQKGYIRSAKKLIKILGNGELTHALTVQADHFSATAMEKIQKAGGKAEVIA